MHKSTLRAFAKLTTTLHITGVREDGFHLIEAEMVSLDLYDTLVFSPSPEIRLSGSDVSLSYDEENLVARALKALGKTARVHIEKCIPQGGGLGGGSSDAAAVFRWARSNDLSLAASVGADVPFCIAGGHALVRGIGEKLEMLPFSSLTYTLLLPPFGVSTVEVFRAFDQMGQEVLAQHPQNHLFAAALRVEPRLQMWREKFMKWTGIVPSLAGSGSTLFVQGSFPPPRDDELEGARWIVAHTVPSEPCAI